MCKDSLYSVRKYFQSIYEVFSKYMWRIVIQQETNKPTSERGKEPFLTGLLCDFMSRDIKKTHFSCVLWSFRTVAPFVFYDSVFGDVYSVDVWTGKLPSTGAGRAGAAWEGGGTPCGGLWDCCIHLCSSLLFPCQDYEEAVLQLLEGASWEEALRLVREVLSSFSCAGCWGR